MEELEELPDDQLTRICFQRGININQTRTELLSDLKLWLSISNKRNVPNILLLVIRLHDFHDNRFSVAEAETEAKILRRVRTTNTKTQTLW